MSISAPAATQFGSYVTGINNNGQVVGYSFSFANQYFVFIYTNGVFTIIPAPADVGEANAINDAGQIVGGADGASFEYSAGIFSTISFPGSSSTDATGINDSSEIVGSFVDSSGNSHGFTDNGGVFTEVDYPDALDTYLTGINDDGEIVGTFTPAPEPRSLLLTGLGLAAALSLSAKRLLPSPLRSR